MVKKIRLVIPIAASWFKTTNIARSIQLFK